MIAKRLRKVIQQIALNILFIKQKEICPYSITDIQGYFECILKRHGEKTIKIYKN